jgi:hypothetical protein
MSHTQRGLDILEVQRAEEDENVHSIHNTQVYATFSRVSIWCITFTHHHILFHSCQPLPLRKGNSQMDRSGTR